MSVHKKIQPAIGNIYIHDCLVLLYRYTYQVSKRSAKYAIIVHQKFEMKIAHFLNIFSTLSLIRILSTDDELVKSGDRSQVQEDWMDGKVPVITATISFGMGVDKATVRWIFLLHFFYFKFML